MYEMHLQGQLSFGYRLDNLAIPVNNTHFVDAAHSNDAFREMQCRATLYPF